MLVCASTEQFPNKSVFIKTVQAHLAILQSMFLIMLRRVCFHYCTWDGGERNEKLIQHQNRNCNLDLILKTVAEFAFTQMTKTNTQSCNEFVCPMIFTIKNTILGWPDKFQEIFLKTLKLPTFRMLWSRLFHSITAEEKTNFSKNK